jgi:hypothetical protein
MGRMSIVLAIRFRSPSLIDLLWWLMRAKQIQMQTG